MKKKTILFALVIISVALFLAGEVLAEECGDGVLPNINFHYIGMESVSPGIYEVRYELTGTKVNDLTSVDLALPEGVDIVSTPGGYQVSGPGEGAQVGNVNWGIYFYDHIVLSGAPQDVGDQKLFYFEVRGNGETPGGAHFNATRGRTSECSITVPAGFQQPAVINWKEVITSSGKKFCVKVDPETQEDVPVYCEGPNQGQMLPRVPIGEILKLGDHPAVWAATPGTAHAVFIIEDLVDGATTCYGSGGWCYLWY